MHRLVLLAVLAILCCASLARASGMTSWSMFSEADFRPQIVENDLRVIVAALKLPDEETRMVRDLHTAHIGRVRDEGAAVKSSCLDLIERTQMLGDGSNLEEVIEKRDAWQKRREALDKEFLDELRLILSAEQEARWSIVERELRRMRAMPDGRMLGESIDAVIFVTDETTDLSPEIADILERYARDVDAALRARDASVEHAKSKDMQALIASDPAECSRLFERIRADRIRVRDLNRKAIADVAARLDPEAGARLRKRLRDAMTAPLHVNDSFALQILTAAAELDSLTESQRARVTAATDAYIATRDAWIDRYLETAMKVEETSVPEQLAKALRGETTPMRGYTMTEARSERTREDPLRKAWEDRIVFEKRTRTDAYALLTPEQRTQMPLMINQVAIRFGELYATYDYLSP